MESYVYLGREMPVATWACVFGWCSYTPEPMLLATCVMACGLGGGGRVARTLGGRALTKLWPWRPTTSAQSPAPSLAACATFIESLLLPEPPRSPNQGGMRMRGRLQPAAEGMERDCYGGQGFFLPGGWQCSTIR